MAKLDFVPNSPTLMNAGIGLQDGSGTGTLSACFRHGARGHDGRHNDHGQGDGHGPEVRRRNGVRALSHQAQGLRNLDHPRPGVRPPFSVLRHLSSVSKLVTQGGKRDGANMAVMDVHHPDILEFVDCKEIEGEIHNFNISVGASHEFMEAVRDGDRLPLSGEGEPQRRRLSHSGGGEARRARGVLTRSSTAHGATASPG